MLKEKVLYYYLDLGLCCAESVLRACNDVYALNIAQEDLILYTGFCGGMASGSVCGCLAASIGVLSKRYVGRENFREICSKFVTVFQEKLGCDSFNCSVLEPKYKTEEARCSACVAIAADALEAYIVQLEN